ncbi:MAG: CRISPR-associated protein Cas4 [Spirochaetes bacterium]|nr:CRISPR-associated protein Cas4 [Spirochaetota bacterium]
MYTDDDFIQLSSLQHYMFCPRQCGLIHVHGLWEENRFTARGRVLHERVDSGEEETRGSDHVVRSLNIYSREYGLSGRADVVEFKDEQGVMRPFPVEYKSGKPKTDERDLVQLCAQAICLEEMTGVHIPEGALFYGKTRHRVKALMTEELRKITIDAIGAVHDMIRCRSVPAGEYQKKCDTCSLNDECMPKLGERKIKRFIEGLFITDEASS